MHQTGTRMAPEQRLMSEEYFFGTAPRILLAEANHDVRRLLRHTLIKCGYCVNECAHGLELMIRLGTLASARDSERADLIISNVRMPGMHGVEVLEQIKKESGYPPVILICTSVDRDAQRHARRHGALPIFQDPYGIEDLIAKVIEAVPPESVAGRHLIP